MTEFRKFANFEYKLLERPFSAVVNRLTIVGKDRIGNTEKCCKVDKDMIIIVIGLIIDSDTESEYWRQQWRQQGGRHVIIHPKFGTGWLFGNEFDRINDVDISRDGCQ